MSRRTVALVVSLVLAAVATVALISYVRGIEERSLKGQKAVDVYVAKETIPAGTEGAFAASKNLIEKTTIPAKVRAEGAITSLDEINGKVAAVTILKGEQIIAARFQLPGQIRGTLPIPQDRMAISLEVAIPPGVAGFVQQGSRISILAELEAPKRGQRNVYERKVQFILQDVEVLAVGQRTVTVQQGQGTQQTTTTSENRVLTTLALTAVQAEKLAYAVLNGNIYFTLLPDQGHKAYPTQGRTRDNPFQ